MAQTPPLVAYIERFRKGREALEPRGDLSPAADFLYLLTGEEPRPESAEELDAALVLT